MSAGMNWKKKNGYRTRGDEEMRHQGEMSQLKCIALCADVLYLYNTLHEILLCQRISAVHHLLQDSCQNNLKRTDPSQRQHHIQELLPNLV